MIDITPTFYRGFLSLFEVFAFSLDAHLCVLEAQIGFGSWPLCHCLSQNIYWFDAMSLLII
jgi:hypothetical protein